MVANSGGGGPAFIVKECFAGTIVNVPGCTYGPHMQRELQIVQLHTGSMQVNIDGRVTEVLPGQVLLLLPGHRVYISSAEKAETWHRWITVFDYEIEAESLEMLAVLPQVLAASEQMTQLIDILVGLHKQGAANTSAGHTLALAAFQLYAADCRKSAYSETHPAISQVKTLIQERFQEELTLDDLAGAANLSPGYLTRLFHQHEGLRPRQYLWRYRVERGIELLRGTGLPIGDIAERCGFKTSYHFARMVKALKKHTPTEIRSGDLE
ncbi:AraC family transcriptional regulator [Paenibacillus nasutitermitis]|uniref:HTH araC/xylS-type domain-containing protein n=1 Tax=Paenibacillus nasutitermitis TaxID=1652958 RepID=A0A916ZGK8_9BACL|nr:AraC family transcriptional regulator [Paenibacillus nasutitermitis]GGD96149.1 hypothetical protein GCM10010911_63530 [Paenibacillus nasutitermitis]